MTMNSSHRSRVRSRFRCLLIIPCLAALAGCSQDEGTGSVYAASRHRVGPPEVYVVNYPLGYFARRIGGDLVKVVMPVPKDEDPAFWAPDAQAILAYQQADLILLNGARYAMWVAKASLPRSRVVDTSVAFRNRLIRIQEAVTHSHGPEGGHAHAGRAFTTWLDPTLAIAQARAILKAFRSRWPEHETRFREGFAALDKDLAELDQRMQDLVAKNKSQPLFVSHPVYQYWIRHYGLNVKSVHWEPDQMPSPEAWEDLEQLHAAHPARWMIWEAPPMDAAVKRLEAMGIQSVVVAPCGNEPGKGDYLQVMRDNLASLAKVFKD